MKRCKWVNPNNETYIKYHDEEWGVPKHNDKELYELLILEMFQAGLSWETILNKRENFRKAFSNFDWDKVCKYDLAKVEELMQDKGIVRCRRKIGGAIENTKAFIEIQKEYGSFDKYIWSFTDGKVIYENDMTSSELSDRISKELKARGMKFVGTTIVYSFLQAIGVIYSHEAGCFMER